MVMGQVSLAENRYLRRRRGKNRSGYRWYVRVNVPDDIREAVGKTAIERALHTSDIREARKRRYAVLAGIFTEFELARKARQDDTPAEATTSIEELLEKIRTRQRQHDDGDTELPPVVAPPGEAAATEARKENDAAEAIPILSAQHGMAAAHALPRKWILTGGLALVAAIGVANLGFLRADSAMGHPQVLPPAMAAAANGSNETGGLTALAAAGAPVAQLQLGLHYMKGKDAARNPALGIYWLHQAAAQHQPVAALLLGNAYKHGLGVKTNLAEAYRWYSEAARDGNRKAMHAKALAAAFGEGTRKNAAEAAHWFREAATRGYVDSQFNLAVLYERGEGVKQDAVAAYKWYAIAAAAGDKGSAERLHILQPQLGSRDIRRAQTQAKAFHPLPLNAAANRMPSAAETAMPAQGGKS